MPTFIETTEQLDNACQRWASLDAIALDTEFERTRTYYSRPALVQVCDGDRTFLIDPLAVDDFEPLAILLRSDRVTKVMHACEGDNEVLELITGALTSTVFDTQMAAAFSGYGYSLGYRNLVQSLLGVELSKQETRSNWLGRPLSDAQIAYAVLDVIHLLPMYRRLVAELANLGREGWLGEETERMQARRLADRDPHRAYLRVPQGRSLAGQELGILRALAAWREQEARRRDRPRQMIVTDAELVALARAKPGDGARLGQVTGVSASTVRRYGNELLSVIGEAGPIPGDDPEPRKRDLTRRRERWLKRLKSVVRRRADELNMPETLLVQTRTLEQLVRRAEASHGQLPEQLQGWRAAVIGEPLMSALAALAAAESDL